MLKQSLVVAFICASSIAQAGTLTKNSIYCISQKALVKFNQYSEQSAIDLRNDLIEKADCVLKKKDEDVFVKSHVGDVVNVTLSSGFDVWVNKEDFKP